MVDPKTWALAVAALHRRLEPRDLARGSRSPTDELRHRLAGLPGYYDALDIAQTIAVAADASAAELITEAKAWDLIFDAAREAQRRFRSWRELGEDYAHGWMGMTDGRAGSVNVESALGGLWATLPWEIDLAPIPQVACPRCLAPRDRPSPRSHVYCDRCATLVEYDLAVAVREPLAPPAPRYVSAHAELASALDTARTSDDRERYRELQLGLHAVWVDATPEGELSIRVRDPEYRTRYVAWLADVATVLAFDADARALELALQATVSGLAFTASERGPRVVLAGFHALRDAALAYYARREQLIAPLLDGHPDAPSAELQRRIDRAALVRGWIRFLEPGDADELVERAGLAREYNPVARPALRDAPCVHCRETLAVVADARRAVCDHCGWITECSSTSR